MLNSEAPYVRYLIGRIVKTYDYINRVVLTLLLSVYEGMWTTLSPLVAMHLHDLHTFSSVTSRELAIQQSVKGELRQHDGMMMLPEQGFA